MTGALAAFQDVTERNRLQAQLARAQKLEAVGQLTGGVAHDFNNLLTIVMNNAVFLRKKAEAEGDEQAVHQAEMIERAAVRGGRLASQLLAFSRRQVLRPESVVATKLLGDLSDLLRRAAGETILLQMFGDLDLWQCRVDPAQLESAVLNLVINARDAMTPEGGRITVEARNEVLSTDAAAPLQVLAGDYIRISVADTGNGMAPEVLARVFEPFFTTKEVGKGSGLGLAQVHGFVGQSGGAVSIDTAVGRGTTVSILLPRDKSARDVAGVEAPSALPEPGAGRTVLVVEDEHDLRESICFSLEKAGYRVVEAPDARTAQLLLRSDEIIDVLFTDVVLPGGVSGVELAREARQQRPTLRLMLTSGYAGETLSRHGAGAQEFELLAKPYEPDYLVRRVGALLADA